MNKIKIFIGAFILLSTAVSCNDFLEVNPSTELTDKTAIVDIKGAEAALTGVYDGMQRQYSYGTVMYTFADLRGGDMQPTASSDSRTHWIYSFNNRVPDNGPGGSLWATAYSNLNRTNHIITAFENELITDGTQEVRNNILGQALAFRGMFHFDVVKIFGVPYAKDKNAWGAVIADHVLVSNERLQRSTVEETYNFAIEDLKKAIDLLKDSKVKKDGYLNWYGAKAILARVYLYKGDWDNAFLEASEIIENSPYALITNEKYISSWAEAFTTESIFSIINLSVDNLSREALSSVSHPEGYGEITLSTVMIDLLKEDPDDVRAQLIHPDKTGQDGWCKKYPGREDIFTNNNPVIRLSEIYLIAAEAALKKSSVDQNAANKYLNAIRLRANPDASEVVATQDLILKERRKELVHEGHRFFDIMRLGLTVERTGGRNFLNLGEVITVSWNDHLTVLPIPRVEINGNPDIQPNPGYSH